MGKSVLELNVNYEIILGNCFDELKKFDSAQFQACVTSPPYWGLRDYEMEGQIGAESSLNEYIKRMVDVFREVKRVLKNDGTLWLNMGDAYTSGGRTWRDTDKKNPARAMSYRPATPEGLKPKDLIGLPWRLAFALQADGWHLRSDIVWYKPNCQPESVKDRPTQSHEYIFLLTKEEKYYYDFEAIKERTNDGLNTRNKRSVWSVKTEPFKDAHFAVFPPSLIMPCIMAGSKIDSWILDPFLGSGTVGEVSLKLNRKCVGIELNPEYIQIAKRRTLMQPVLPFD
jgi:site-specific DNA-methyltransferase (adenine-specific)/site-specific DNA-methyltransferase (cytosine-N4-specific)